MAIFVFSLGMIAGMAMVTFAFQNRELVTLRYLFAGETPPIPLSAVLMASVGVGFGIASLFGIAAFLRQRRTIRGQKYTIAALQAELHTLRILPLDAPAEPLGGARGAMQPLDATGTRSPP